MSKTFAYATAYDPPAPVCEVTLLPPAASQGIKSTALLDTGADVTLVPLQHLVTIGAQRVFEAGLRSQWGERRNVFLYLVDVQIGEVKLPGIYVVGDDLGAEVVIGRDVLNRLRLTLNGPALLTQILE